MAETAQTMALDAERTMRERLAHYMSLTNLSNREIASALGLPSDAQVARYLAGDDDPKLDIESRVTRLFNFEPGEEQWEALPFDNTVTVWEMSRLAARRRRMVAISGRSGYGKTSALRLYARLVGAVHYEYDEVSSCRDALRKMCKLVGIPHVHRSYSIGKLRDLLLEKLRNLGLPLIVDQFDTAPFRLVEAVRGMWDEARIPVIIAGLDGRLFERLKRRNAREHCEQILSRLSSHVSLLPPSEGDADLLCRRFGIRAASARGFLHTRGVIGGYRVMRILCEDAEEIAQKNGLRAITLECLKYVAPYIYCAAGSDVDEAAQTNHLQKGETHETP